MALVKCFLDEECYLIYHNLWASVVFSISYSIDKCLQHMATFM